MKTLLTYDQWERLHTSKQHAIQMFEYELKEEKRKEFYGYLFQRVFGLLMCLFGIVIPFIAGGEAMIGTIFLILVGVTLILTKEKVV